MKSKKENAIRAVLIFFLGIFYSQAITNIGLPYFNYADYHCMVENAFHEARSDGPRGMRAVTHVVMNRMRKYNKDACSIIHAPKQFSWTAARYKNTKGESKKLASDVVWSMLFNDKGEKHIPNDITKGSLFYHHSSIKPAWSKKMVVKERIGHHHFM